MRDVRDARIAIATWPGPRWLEFRFYVRTFFSRDRQGSGYRAFGHIILGELTAEACIESHSFTCQGAGRRACGLSLSTRQPAILGNQMVTQVHLTNLAEDLAFGRGSREVPSSNRVL